VRCDAVEMNCSTQLRDVVATLAQRRQPNDHHAQAVIQILAKALIGGGAFEVDVGGRHHARVGVDRALPADRAHLAVLKDAQQLDLHRRRRLADLVEKDGSTVRLFEHALAIGNRAGEGSAHVTKQLRLQQGFGERPAVDGDKTAARNGGCADESRARPAPCRCRSRP
jgi:hypothetical protein